MEGIELLRQTRDVMQTLSDKINTAGIQSSFTEGRYHHFIAHGMDIPSSFAYGFFRELVEEAEKSPDVLSRLPMDKVQEVYNKAKEAIDTGIEASIAYLADALSNKAGQSMTEEDTQNMQPSFRVREALEACDAVREAYKGKQGK